MTEYNVLGTPLLATSYADLEKLCLEWARKPGPTGVEFANTQIVTMRRHDPEFAEIHGAFHYLVPDGMPLIWCMNRGGARLKDRVYGPTFMRKFMSHSPAGATHYLLGSTEEVGKLVRERFQRENPNIRFVGSFHGRCGPDGMLDRDAEVIEELNRLSPDFIWLGFGAPKQQTWVSKHLHLLKRGVVFTIGFGYDVNAGTKPDAPVWMQRVGLTWMFRLATEPKRLGPRYLKYNLLFLFYLLRDSIRGGAIKPVSRPLDSPAVQIR
jgi:N-acetylglucosaminyldiphosphoundecaprenol N-acetyl-beta-D-mannosaminyltransferase